MLVIQAMVRFKYAQVQERDARAGDIVVWYNGNETIHTAVLNNAVITDGQLNRNQTTLRTKNGRLPFENAMSLDTVCEGPLSPIHHRGYGNNFRVFRAR
jgi:hypothetical protein